MITEVLLRGRRTLLERHRLLSALPYLQRQLRCDSIRDVPSEDHPPLRISLHDWSHPSATPLAFDRLFASVERQGSFRLVLYCGDWLVGSQHALELLNRYQRLLPQRGDAPVPHCWSAVLDAHRKHCKPELYDAGLDTWRWLLRLSDAPSAKLQLAALFHEPVAGGSDPALLQTARDLSFFSLDSWAHLRERGAAVCCASVRRRLRRMDSSAICHVLTTRQPAVISDAIDAFLAENSANSRSSLRLDSTEIRSSSRGNADHELPW